MTLCVIDLTFLAEVTMLNYSAINPFIRVAMYSTLPKSHEIKRRIIFDYELLYVADGEFTLNYNDVDYTCKTGQFVLLHPNVPHSFSRLTKDLDQPHVHFDITHVASSTSVPVSFKDFDALDEKEKGWIREDIFEEYPKTPFVTFSHPKAVLQLFYGILDSHESAILTRKAKLIQIIEHLINDNFPGVFKQENTAYNIENAVKGYIDAGQGLASRLEDISRQFNYSKYHLDRRFKAKYGVGIMAYRNEKRMQMAKDMLQTETVSTVAERLGFSSIYVFSRAFKNHFGYPPSDSKQ